MGSVQVRSKFEFVQVNEWLINHSIRQVVLIILVQG